MEEVFGGCVRVWMHTCIRGYTFRPAGAYFLYGLCCYTPVAPLVLNVVRHNLYED